MTRKSKKIDNKKRVGHFSKKDLFCLGRVEHLVELGSAGSAGAFSYATTAADRVIRTYRDDCQGT